MIISKEKKYLSSLEKLDRSMKSDNLQEIIKKACQEIKKSLKIKDVCIAIHDPKKESIESEKLLFKVGRCSNDLNQWIIKNKRPVIINENVEKFFRQHRIKRKARIPKSLMCIPVKYQDDVVGVITAQNYNKSMVFTEEDKFLLMTIAARLGLVFAHNRLVEQNRRLVQDLKALSLTDSLTEIANRRYFELILEREIKKAKGYSRPCSMALIDLDHFKKFNEKHGYKMGDKMLIHIARVLKRNVRETDFVARYCDEEFMIIFPETNNEAALKVSERIRNAIANAPLLIRGVGKKQITVSVGMVTYPHSAESSTGLLKSIDVALKRAKQLGRNRVETI